MVGKSVSKHEDVFFPQSTPKSALITGAGRGIGREIALSLAIAGVECTLISRTESELKSCSKEATERGSPLKPITFPCDLSDPDALRQACNQLTGDGDSAYSIVVHAAGIAQSAPLKSASTEGFDQMMAVNARAFLILMRELSPLMSKQGFGRMIAIGSVAGLRGYPYVASYCASKHALIGLVRAGAKEFARKGITVNAICPGYVDTPMTQATLSAISEKTGRSIEEARAELESMSPQQRLIQPDEIVSMTRFLLSAGAHGINGQALSVCGGEIA